MRARGTWTTTALLSAAILLTGCTGNADPRPTATVADGTAPAVPTSSPTVTGSPSASPTDDASSGDGSSSGGGATGGSGGASGGGSGGGSDGDGSGSGGSGGGTSGGSGGGSGGGSSKPPSATQPCTDGALAVSVAADPERSEMGRRAFRITFKNTGKVACTLRGFPQVGATGRGDRTPIGTAAEPDVRYTAKTERLAAGGSVAAILLADNIDANGGPYNDGDTDRCGTTTGTGYNISPPASPKVFWVPRDGMLACTTDVMWMRVSPVLVP